MEVYKIVITNMDNGSKKVEKGTIKELEKRFKDILEAKSVPLEKMKNIISLRDNLNTAQIYICRTQEKPADIVYSVDFF